MRIKWRQCSMCSRLYWKKLGERLENVMVKCSETFGSFHLLEIHRKSSQCKERSEPKKKI